MDIKNTISTATIMSLIIIIIFMATAQCNISDITKEHKKQEEPIKFNTDVAVAELTEPDGRADISQPEPKTKKKTRRPLKFKKFVITVEILSKESIEDTEVKNKINKLIKLATSVSDIKNMKTIKLEGIAKRNGSEMRFNLD